MEENSACFLFVSKPLRFTALPLTWPQRMGGPQQCQQLHPGAWGVCAGIPSLLLDQKVNIGKAWSNEKFYET